MTSRYDIKIVVKVNITWNTKLKNILNITSIEKS